MTSHNHKFNNFRVDYKIWLDNSKDEGILGKGKIELLKQIDKTGSMMAAANKLKISYRKAWGDIKNAELLLGVQLIKRKRGGTAGGNSSLTKDAAKIIKAWNKLHTKVDNAIEDIIIEFKKFIKEK